ncbi:hypothetical protein Cni_G17309 [Canna indica]|uniref:RNase H type-1 domain-containing protein n=1 Tax=Canna indica TaxID=4628 RepID=A0AAQ3QDF8_9LILI|nr:hypothetical protein Cni_G17309 [Canna indica]
MEVSCRVVASVSWIGDKFEIRRMSPLPGEACRIKSRDAVPFAVVDSSADKLTFVCGELKWASLLFALLMIRIIAYSTTSCLLVSLITCFALSCVLFDCFIYGFGNYWKHVERKLNIKFRYKDVWKKGQWFKEADSYEPETTKKLKAFMEIYFWWIWKNRNRAKHEGKKWGESALFNKVLAETMNFESKKTPKEISREEISKADLLSRYKEVLCCDASWRQDTRIGDGFVFFEEGEITWEGAVTDYVEDLMRAEMKSIWYGLDNVKKKGKKGICVASDCEKLVKILMKSLNVPWQLEGLVKEIWSIAEIVRVKRWCFLRREGNVEAHNNAKFVIEMSR